MLERIAHDAASEHFEKRHRDGDPTAIFEFVNSDHLSLEAPWVSKQLSDWTREQTSESIAKARRLVIDKTDTRGRGPGATRLAELRSEIERDQRIVKELYAAKATGRSLLACRKRLGDDAAPGPLTERAVRETYDQYRAYQREWLELVPNSTDRTSLPN